MVVRRLDSEVIAWIIPGGSVEQTLTEWGWDDRWEAVLHESDPEQGHRARVTSQQRDRWTLQTETGPQPARLLGSGLNGPLPATGDWVIAEPGPFPSDPWAITSVLPRRSAVARGSAGEGQSTQVLASNVDRLWIVHGLDAPPNLRRIERYLAVGWESGASPELVLTKADLAADLDVSIDAAGQVAIGVPLWVVSKSDSQALSELKESLAYGSTVALVGPSGVGKSTLINLLAGTEVARTGDVRAGDRKGRHTTTSRELIQIHNGALLLDTPGLRELRVLTLDEGLGRTFPEIDELAAHCRFRDCSHRTEPGCAVLHAVEDGTLAADRLASFRKLEAEAAYEQRRVDPQAMAEAVARHKTIMKTMKHHPKHQRGK